MTYDVAVVTPTIIRPQLDKAVKSVFTQDFDGKIQMLVGLDYPCGNKEELWSLQIQAPRNVQLDVLHLGYSTKVTQGGCYYNYGGGALRTILTFAAGARYVAYLDDDCWYERNHLSSLMDLIQSGDYDWVYSDWMEVDDSGVGVEHDKDWIDTNCFLIDKVRCHEAIHGWSRVQKAEEQEGELSFRDEFDFQDSLDQNNLDEYAGTGLATVNYGLTNRVDSDIFHK